MTTYLLSDRAKAAKTELTVEAQAVLLDVMETLRETPTQGYQLPDSPYWSHRHPKHNLRITYKFDEKEDVIEFLDFVAAVVVVERPVFISYSHDDEKWFEILRAKLAGLEETENGVQFWADSDIEPGEKWERKIRERLGSAKGALLMISPAFLDSEFIRATEVPAFLEAAASQDDEDGFVLLWFLLSQCDLDANPTGQRIAEFQALVDPEKPLDSVKKKKKRDKALDKIRKKVARAIAKQS